MDRWIIILIVTAIFLPGCATSYWLAPPGIDPPRMEGVLRLCFGNAYWHLSPAQGNVALLQCLSQTAPGTRMISADEYEQKKSTKGAVICQNTHTMANQVLAECAGSKE